MKNLIFILFLICNSALCLKTTTDINNEFTTDITSMTDNELYLELEEEDQEFNNQSLDSELEQLLNESENYDEGIVISSEDDDFHYGTDSANDSDQVEEDEDKLTARFLADDDGVVSKKLKNPKSTCTLDQNTQMPMTPEEVEYFVEETPVVKNHLHGEPKHKILGPYTKEQIDEMTKYNHVVIPSESRVDEIYREEATKENHMSVGEIVQEDIELKAEDDKLFSHLKKIEKLITDELAAGKTDDDAYVKVLMANYQRAKDKVKDLDTKIDVTGKMMSLKEDREYKKTFQMMKLKKLAMEDARREAAGEYDDQECQDEEPQYYPYYYPVIINNNQCEQDCSKGGKAKKAEKTEKTEKTEKVEKRIGNVNKKASIRKSIPETEEIIFADDVTEQPLHYDLPEQTTTDIPPVQYNSPEVIQDSPPVQYNPPEVIQDSPPVQYSLQDEPISPPVQNISELISPPVQLVSEEPIPPAQRKPEPRVAPKVAAKPKTASKPKKAAPKKKAVAGVNHDENLVDGEVGVISEDELVYADNVKKEEIVWGDE
jgi:hypothetical protein